LAEESKDLNNDNASTKTTGLIHYYRGQDGQWKEIEEHENESRKGELPNLCFATRYPIEASKKEYLAELMENMPTLEPAEEAKVHSVGDKTIIPAD